MADRKKRLAVFGETGQPTPAPSGTPAPKRRGRYKDPSDPVRSWGVSLRNSEWETVNAIAGELGVKPQELIAWLTRDFIKRWQAGERPPTETKTVLKTD